MPVVTTSCPNVTEGTSQIIQVDGRSILLCRTGGTLHAMDAMCPHQRLSLEGARIRKGALLCPHHGARFDIATGKSLSPLTPKPLNLIPVRESSAEIELEL